MMTLKTIYIADAIARAQGIIDYRTGWYMRHNNRALPADAPEAMRAGWLARDERHDAMVRADAVSVEVVR